MKKSKIEQYLLNRGDFIKSEIDTFLSHCISDVLNYAYSLEDVEKYIESEKQIIRARIKQLFKDRRQYVFRDTDMDFELTKDFFEDTLNFHGDLLKFNRQLNKFSAEQLRKIENILFRSDLLLEKDREDSAFVAWADGYFTKDNLNRYIVKLDIIDDIQNKILLRSVHSFKVRLKNYCALRGYLFNPEHKVYSNGRFMKHAEGRTMEVIYIQSNDGGASGDWYSESSDSGSSYSE